MQVILQISRDPGGVAHIDLALGGVELQFCGERDRAGDEGVVDLAGVGDEMVGDGVGADEIGVDGPAFRVRRKITEEDVDEEGGFDGGFEDADVGDPFLVGALLEHAEAAVGGAGHFAQAAGDGGGYAGWASGAGWAGRGGWQVGGYLHRCRGLGVGVSLLDGAATGKCLARAAAVDVVDGFLHARNVFPVDLRVAVSERFGVLYGFWGMETAACVFVERSQRTVLVQMVASFDGSGSGRGDSGAHVTVIISQRRLI